MAMAFRGLGKPTDQLDIQMAQPSDSGYGAPQLQQPPMMPQAAAPKSGFGTRDVVGIIGDTLSAMGGGQGVYTQMKLRDREQERQQQLAGDQRQQGLADWLWKQQWERDNPAPAQPTELERLAVASGLQPGTPEYTASLRQGFQNRIDPIQGVPTYGADGSQYLQFLRSSQLAGGGVKGGGQGISSQTVPASQGQSSGPNAPHLTVDQMGAFGSAFKGWQQREKVPVLVNSPEDIARVPAGTIIISPDGRTGVKQ